MLPQINRHPLVLSFSINPIEASVGGLGSYCHGSWALSRDHGHPLPVALAPVAGSTGLVAGVSDSPEHRVE